MQDLLIISDEQVVVQNHGLTYSDTPEHFFDDGGRRLPAGVKTVDYNKSTQSCWINGQPFQAFPYDYAEKVLADVSVLCEAFERRKAVIEAAARVKREEAEDRRYEEAEAERIAKMNAEERRLHEREIAKVQRSKAVSEIVVKVDGLAFNGDENSQRRMNAVVSAAGALGMNLNKITRSWILADNSVAKVTASQLARALLLATEAQSEIWTKVNQA